MAISAGMVWQAQNGGSDTTCSGGFRGGANLSTPAAPTAAATAGGSVGAATYQVLVTFTDGNGETPQSAATAVTTSGGNLTITVTTPANPGGAMTWNVYIGTAVGGPYFLQNTGGGLAFGTNRVITATPPTSGTQAPGVDYSLLPAGGQLHIDNAIQTATTPGANSNTLTFTGPYIPTAADVGNTYNATGGTNINVGVYEITAFTATTWTLTGAQNLTTAGGAGAALTGYMGGAFASPALATKYMDTATAGNILFIKYSATPYSCSSSTQVASGALLLASRLGYIIGYNTNRTIYNTDALRPILDCTSNSFTPVSLSTTGCYVANLAVTNSAAHTGINGISVLAAGRAYNCTVDACAYGFRFAGSGWQSGENLYASNCSASGGYQLTATANLINCVANTCKISFDANGMTGILDRCIAINGTGVGFGTLAGNVMVRNCVVFNNGANGGFTLSYATLENCICYGTTGAAIGFSNTTSDVRGRLVNCAGGSNGSGGDYVATAFAAGAVANFVTLTASPFTSTGGLDFSLNNTTGGGAACKGVGTGSTAATQLPVLSTLSYLDLGVAQSQQTISQAVAGPLPIGQTTGVF